MVSLQFVLWKSAGVAPGQHLALYHQTPPDAEDDAQPVLAHWMLPQQHQRMVQQSHSLLVETPNFPPLEHVLDTGLCTLVRGSLPTTAGIDRLHLCFAGNHLRGHYSLLRLQANSTRWLFGQIQYMPDKFERGHLVAPLWPTTQTKLV
jgi:hypothetical protein